MSELETLTMEESSWMDRNQVIGMLLEKENGIGFYVNLTRLSVNFDKPTIVIQ